MQARLIINLVSTPGDAALRSQFADAFQADNRALYQGNIAADGRSIPRITIAGDYASRQVAIVEYVAGDCTDGISDGEDDAELTVFVFDCDNHATMEHVRTVALADYSVEVSGILPGGLTAKKGYIQTARDTLAGAWRHILGDKLVRNGVSQDVSSLDGPVNSTDVPMAPGSKPAVGHWG